MWVVFALFSCVTAWEFGNSVLHQTRLMMPLSTCSGPNCRTNTIDSRIDVQCYCKSNDLSASCNVSCSDAITCNGHGKCNENGGCNCFDGWGGTWCEGCKLGRNSSTEGACDICAKNWYPKSGPNMCSTYCDSSDAKYGCGGRGNCNDLGICECKAEYAGQYCTRCNYPYVYLTFPNCKLCTRASNCSGGGECALNGTCICDIGKQGSACQLCVEDNDNWPLCNKSIAAAARGAGQATCPPESFPVLAVVLSVLGTLLLCGLAIGAYYFYLSRSASAAEAAGTGAGAKNWVEFDKDSSTAYSQL